MNRFHSFIDWIIAECRCSLGGSVGGGVAGTLRECQATAGSGVRDDKFNGPFRWALKLDWLEVLV